MSDRYGLSIVEMLPRGKRIALTARSFSQFEPLLSLGRRTRLHIYARMIAFVFAEAILSTRAVTSDRWAPSTGKVGSVCVCLPHQCRVVMGS